MSTPRIHRIDDPNEANWAISRHNWTAEARARAGLPDETLVETLRRLEASTSPTAKAEHARLIGKRAK